MLITVVYNANGKTSGGPDTVSESIDLGVGDPIPVIHHNTANPTTPWVKTSYRFISWNTKADGTGTNYPENLAIILPLHDGGTTIPIVDGLVLNLYAIWAITKHIKLIYHSNGEVTHSVSGTTIYSEDTIEEDLYLIEGESFGVTGNTWVKPNNIFRDFNSKADGTGTDYLLVSHSSYTDGTTVTPLTDGLVINLYAIWMPDVTVIYHANGKTSVGDDTYSTLISYFVVSIPHRYALYLEIPDHPVLPPDVANVVNSWSKDYYRFASWNTAPDGTGTSYPIPAPILIGTAYATPSVTINPIGTTFDLYTIWEKTHWVLTLHENGGTGSFTPTYISVTQAVTFSFRGYFSRTGYLLTSYTTNADGSGFSILEGGNLPARTENLELYVQWTERLILHYDSNGGTGGNVPNDVDYPKGSHLTKTVAGTTVTKSHYLFKNWNTKADGTGVPYVVGSSFVTGDSNITLYAQWDYAYVITFNCTSIGAPTAYEDIYYLGDIDYLFTVPAYNTYATKLDYKQVGWWYSDTIVEALLAPDAQVTLRNTNLELFPIFIPEYSVSFEVNHSANAGNLPDLPKYTTTATTTTTYVIPLTTTYATTPITKGWIDNNHVKLKFIDWNTSSDGTGTIYAPGSTITLFRNIVILYAQWEVAFRIKFIFSGSGDTRYSYPEINDVITFHNYKEVFNTQTNPSDRVFLGWNTLDNGTGVEYLVGSTFTVIDNTELVLYAQFTVSAGVKLIIDRNYINADTDNKASIFFKSQFSGGLPIPEVYLPGSIVTLSSSLNGDISNNHCGFIGWSLLPDGSNLLVEGDTVTLTETKTLYVIWKYFPNVYYYSSLGWDGQVGMFYTSYVTTLDRGNTPYPVYASGGKYFAYAGKSKGSYYSHAFDTPAEAELALYFGEDFFVQADPTDMSWNIYYYDYDPAFPNDDTKADFYSVNVYGWGVDLYSVWLEKNKRVPKRVKFIKGTPLLVSDGTISSSDTMSRPYSILSSWKLRSRTFVPVNDGVNPVHLTTVYADIKDCAIGETLSITYSDTITDYYLDAQWNVSLTVVYATTNSDGGLVPATKVYLAGSTVTIEATTLHRQHYILEGWLFNGSLVLVGGTFIMPDLIDNTHFEVILIPKWKALPRVDYTSWGVPMELPPFNSYTSGDIVTVQYIGSHINTTLKKKFEKWLSTTSPYEFQPNDTFIMPDHDVELQALWLDIFEISFAYSPEDIDTVDITRGSLVTLKTKLSTNGTSQFSHWAMGVNSYPDGYSFYLNDNNLVFTAVWKPLDVISTNSLYTVYVKPK